MKDVKEIAKELISSGKVSMIIGYGKKANRVVPVIVRKPEEAEGLVFDHYSVNNLAVYLNRFGKKPEGKIGIVAKGCDIRAIIALIQENQIKRDDIYIIGAHCNTVVADTEKSWSKDNIAAKCIVCQVRTPQLADEVFGEQEIVELPAPKMMETLKKIEVMTPRERWNFWNTEFEKCIRCFACRQSCPLCNCDQCLCDKTMPRWIDSSATQQGNFAWNIIRAFHQSGRCIGCGECDRVCPVGIPLSLLNAKMAMVALDEFDYRAGSDINAETLIGTYRLTDKEEFIK